MRMPISERSKELMSLSYTGMHNIRFEHLGMDLGYEQKCYISNSSIDIYQEERAIQTIEFVGIDRMRVGKSIPNEILEGLRCPNCGAPVRSRYGACDYCSGWTEVEW